MAPFKRHGSNFTLVETEAIKLGKSFYGSRWDRAKMSKKMFNNALKNRETGEILKEMKQLTIMERTRPSMAPLRDKDLAICLGVEFFGNEDPSASLEYTKDLYKKCPALRDMTLNAWKKRYEDELVDKKDKILSLLGEAEEERRSSKIRKTIMDFGDSFCSL